MPFTLRRLGLGDMDRAAAVLRCSFDERLPWLAGLHTPAEDRAFFRGHVFATCEVWGALVGADLAGVIAFRPGWVDQLCVSPEHQGRGLGGALLGVAMERGAPLSLWTFQRNAGARAFYEARGFAPVDWTDGAANEEREPDVLYRWEGPAEG